MRGHPLFRAVLAYMGYLLLSGLWSQPLEWYRLGQMCTISVYLLGFFAITHYLVQFNGTLFRRSLEFCVLFAAVAATVNIVAFYGEHPFPQKRLAGVGTLTNINEFAVLYGVFAILAMGFALDKKPGGLRALFLLTPVVFIAFAWFGQSRTALAALLLAMLVQLGLTLDRRRPLYLGLGVLAALLLALLLVFPESVEQALLRGRGLRPDIWSEVLKQALHAPLFGNGLVSPLLVETGGRQFANAHSAYLQVFWQGGLVGLGLFLAVLGVAFRHAWSLARTGGNYTVFCLLLFAATVMITDLDTLIARPREQWMLFWFPLAMVLALQNAPPAGLSRRRAAIDD
jgi:O-antigen ligase